jgi:septum site-determining protein MinD
MRIISVASGKGGVGRTTLVANLGIALSKLGKETIIVDACFTTPDLALLFKLEKAMYTINDVLNGETQLDNVIHDGPMGVKIAPAAVALKQIKKTRPEQLPEVLRNLPENTDFVLIDTSGGLRRETVAAIRSSSETLLVTTPDMVSVSDCMKTRLIAEFLGSRPLGIVLNRVRGEDFELDSKEIKEIMNLPILGTIPEDEKVMKALKEGVPVLVLEPKSPASIAINNLAQKIVRTSA